MLFLVWSAESKTDLLFGAFIIGYFGTTISFQIHAAGSTKLRGISACTIEDLDWTYDITVRSTFMLLKAVKPFLETTQGKMMTHFLFTLYIRPTSCKQIIMLTYDKTLCMPFSCALQYCWMVFFISLSYHFCEYNILDVL